MFKKYIKLMRVKHYIKNLIILLPLIFSKSFTNENIFLAVIGLIVFSLVSSFIYIINDIKDVEKDKLHEVKKHRPIASGTVLIKNAIIIGVLLLIIAIIISVLYLNYWSLLLITIYIIINIYYSFGGKNIPILDIIILTAGFVIRLYYGALIFNIEISNWLYLTILFASLYLSLGKRRNEIINSQNTRKVLKFYTKDFLDKNMYMCLTLMIVFYSLWCVDPTTIIQISKYLIWTVPLIFIIFMKYNLNIELNGHGDPVDVLYEDKVLLILTILYGIIILLNILI